jgi:GR25 family glycosyltransferase involved in LPS biosynthesis
MSGTAKAHIAKNLPFEYRLGENDVYCGRERQYNNHIGNLRFNTIVEANLERYCNARNKKEKSSIIYEVVDQVRANSPGGGFVKRSVKSTIWYEIGDTLAVSTISASILIRKFGFCFSNFYDMYHLCFSYFFSIKREKTSQAFRDATVGMYKSSVHEKKKKQVQKAPTHAEKMNSSSTLSSKTVEKRVNHDVYSRKSMEPLQQSEESIAAYQIHDDHLSSMLVLTHSARPMLEDAANNFSVVVPSNIMLDNSFLHVHESRKMTPNNKCCNEGHFEEVLDRFDSSLSSSSDVSPSLQQMIETNVQQIQTKPLAPYSPDPSTEICSTKKSQQSSNAADPVPPMALDTKSDEETFDILFRMCESWQG